MVNLRLLILILVPIFAASFLGRRLVAFFGEGFNKEAIKGVDYTLLAAGLTTWLLINTSDCCGTHIIVGAILLTLLCKTW